MIPHRILVAHEDAFARRYLCGLFERPADQGPCLEAEHFDALVEQVTGHPVVMVALVDLDLPGLSIEPGLHSLSSQFPALRLALLFSSLSSGDASKLKGLRIAALLPKTTPEDELTRSLRRISSMAAAGYEWPIDAEHEEEGLTSPAFEATMLTARQSDVMRLLCEGLSNREIANRLQLAEGTVKCHVNAGFRILGVHNRVCAARAFRKAYLDRTAEQD